MKKSDTSKNFIVVSLFSVLGAVALVHFVLWVYGNDSPEVTLPWIQEVSNEEVKEWQVKERLERITRNSTVSDIDYSEGIFYTEEEFQRRPANKMGEVENKVLILPTIVSNRASPTTTFPVEELQQAQGMLQEMDDSRDYIQEYTDNLMAEEFKDSIKDVGLIKNFNWNDWWYYGNMTRHTSRYYVISKECDCEEGDKCDYVDVPTGGVPTILLIGIIAVMIMRNKR